MITVYLYKNCSTCQKAKSFLKNKGIAFEEKAIRETPPSVKELKTMLGFYEGDLKRLFNTSGLDYRNLNIKDKLPKLTEKEALELLASTGNLIKRPFALGAGWGRVGFKEDEWKDMVK